MGSIRHIRSYTLTPTLTNARSLSHSQTLSVALCLALSSQYWLIYCCQLYDALKVTSELELFASQVNFKCDA